MDNTWLQYAPTANKFKQTYVRGFIDISGNTIIRNGGLNIVNGNINIGTNLDVNANGRIKGNLTIDRSIYAGTLDISNSATGPGLTVRQFANQPVATFYKGNVMMVSINDSGDISANRNLNVGGNIILSGSSTAFGITKSMVGLGSADNTSDANKPVSTAQQTALDLKANLASPTFTGTINVPTVSITATTISTSTTTGALVVTGGAGIGGNAYIDGVQVSNLAGSGNRAIYSTAAGYLTNTSSDVSLKTNIEPIDATTTHLKILQLQPKTYQWIDTEKYGTGTEIGLIAQEVIEHMPELVWTGNDDKYGLNYDRIPTLLLQSIKELQRQIDELKVEIAILKPMNI